ncbi:MULTISPECIES: hypothetical protein [Pseudomonas]|uniref:Uncharacterized protein n=1 Tax=Pseudomonas wuhanensis TaxID=2954098 RepID=A0ABY9GLI2_9PSED|nr:MULTISPECIES: hypothetical protein [unclassified Pseudomonas]WLI10787.1 hypothetical protein PSH65_21775 [Pseudomonas sp. FP603]WLI16608.1 hypothetical protein PSH88_20400 [Pseudomonas sp. FP607]
MTQALITKSSTQNFSGAPLPSGASVSTQSMVFSHDGSAGTSTGVPGPSRNRPAHAVSSAPYQAPSLSSRSGAASEGQPPKRRGATDNQITAHLHNDDGSLRTHKDVISALRAAGLGAGAKRIGARLQAAGGGRRLRGTTGEQINAHLRNDDGSLRTHKDVASALRAAGLGADTSRITAQLQAAGGTRRLRGTTDAQIDAHLHNDDGSLRTQTDVLSALHAVGLGASSTRIAAQVQAAGGGRHLPGATDEQINAHLHNDDGSLRTQSAVASALRAAGLGAGNARITARLQAARGPQ